MSDSITIGIDLGTTNSCAAVYRYQTETIFNSDTDSAITPSVVAFTPNGRIIGEGAKSHAIEEPSNVVYCVKRLIGRTFSDPHVQKDIKMFPFKVVEGHNNKPRIEVYYQKKIEKYSPEDISAMVLSKIKQIAKDFFDGQEVTKAVITVPAYFNDAQRQATKDAGEGAGLNVVRIINEPTAAALAYGFSEDSKHEKTVLVFDFGGGTLDVTILTIGGGVLEVKSTSGDTHLGGEDCDNILMKHFANEFKVKHGEDPLLNKKALSLLKAECEKLKKALSANSYAEFDIENFMNHKDFRSRISRAKFENLCSEIFKSILQPVKKALSDASLTAADIDDVILVGGSTRIPKVQKTLSEYFGRIIKLNDRVNPDEAVAHGAAIQGAIMDNKKGKIEDLVLIDVIPHSIGVKTKGGRMTKMILRNSSIPSEAMKKFSTSQDNQTSVEITIFEGEDDFTCNNRVLGSFKLQGIPPMPAGKPKIEVTVFVNENGIVNVKAKENNSGNAKEIEIVTDKNGLTESERNAIRIREEAEQRREEKRKELEAAKNKLKTCWNEITSEASNEPAKSRLTLEQHSAISQAVQKAKAALDGLNNIKEVNRQRDLLISTCEPILSSIDDDTDLSSNMGEMVIEELSDDDN